MSTNVEIKFGAPYPKRVNLLRGLEKDTEKYTFPLKFQGPTRPFPVYSVSIDLPKYRLANGRTQASQEMYLAKKPELPVDFFTKDLESDQAQEIQHVLLLKMVEKSPLYDYFKKTSNSQDEPLILTSNGFVVNGNRRLCAMREFFYSSNEKYKKYRHVDVIILPVCEEKDLDELEAYLQIQPDIKQDYTWIAKACMLRVRQERYGYTNKQLATLYSISEKDVQNTLAQLALVDEYLTNLGKPKQYDDVDQNEFAFKQLLKGRQQVKAPGEKDLFTKISFCLIENSDAVEGRLYERIPEIKENIKVIADRLSSEIQPEMPQEKNENTYSIFGNAVETDGLGGIAAVVTKPENREVVLETVIDVIDSKKEKDKQRKKANAVFNQIRDANTSLKNALNFITEDTSKPGIEEQLASIENSIREIRQWLN